MLRPAAEYIVDAVWVALGAFSVLGVLAIIFDLI